MAEQRSHYKQLMKTVTPGSMEHQTYDKLQDVFKFFGLSFYGALGEQNSRFFDVRIAEAVTLGGQYFTKTVEAFLRKNGINVIYGDTDSLFFPLKNVNDIKKIIPAINEVCRRHAIQKFNADDSHLSIEYDKGFHKFVIMAKKRYAGTLSYLDGHEIDHKLYVAGLEYKRTDQCPYLKRKQKELLDNMLGVKDYTLAEAKEFISECKRHIFQGNVPIEDIVFGQKLTKDVVEYKSETMHLKVIREMTELDEEVWIGDKIMYFIEGVDKEGKGIPRPVSQYTGKFSQLYYWNKKIFPPLERILQVVFPEYKWEYMYVKLPSGKKNAEVGRMIAW
jgi:DNA polymerase elongation subunit (family B)